MVNMSFSSGNAFCKYARYLQIWKTSFTASYRSLPTDGNYGTGVHLPNLILYVVPVDLLCF